MKNLLSIPEGVRDIIGTENRVKTELIQRTLNVIAGYGYSMISTPSFEYFECFSGDIGTTPSNKLYKIIDKNGDTLALRPDFTPSIARVYSRYFAESHAVCKFSYAGDVFRNQDTLKGWLCESTQMGIEHIGDGGIMADAEVIAMAAECLKVSGIEKFVISIGHSGLFRILCEKYANSEEEVETLKSLIANKNSFGLEEYMNNKHECGDIEKRELFIKCLESSITDEELRELKEGFDPESEVHKIFAYLEDLMTLLKAYGVRDYINIDLSKVNDYSYYSGIIFLGYVTGTGNAVLSGGRYDGLLQKFGADAPAIGFAIEADQLLDAVIRQGCANLAPEVREIVMYKADESLFAIDLATRLRHDGRLAVLVHYETEEEHEMYNQLFSNDNVYTITREPVNNDE